MNKTLRKLLTAAAAMSMLLAAGTASADRGGWGDRGEYRGWRHHEHRSEWREHRHHHRHWRAEHRDRIVVRERVVVRDRPVYRAYDPAPVYGRPAVVIGVSLPPLVIPLP